MTQFLKDLLRNYGLLYITLTQLLSERPGNKYASLDEYYHSLGMQTPDNPMFYVHPSSDGKTRYLDEGEHDIEARDDAGNKVGKVVGVLELPEDEFYFFQAFRPGMFDLEKDLPSFLFEMALIYANSLFENYISSIIRLRFQKHPELMGVNKQVTYGQVIKSNSKQDVIEHLINREVQQLMYEPIGAVLERMRAKYGFRDLTTKYDEEIIYLSLIRNCVMHNSRKVDSKLATNKPKLVLGERLPVEKSLVDTAIHTYRKFCYEVDIMLEAIGSLKQTSEPL